MPNFIGIPGLTFGGAGIWTLIIFAFGAIVQKWVVGIADRKRAENEGVVVKQTAEDGARQQIFEQMLRSQERLEGEVISLRARVSQLENVEREHLKEINRHLTEIASLKGQRKNG